jgi:DNA-binding response OmpR family regulator
MNCCPSCGFNLARDEIVESGDWRLDPRGEIYHAGRLVRLPPAINILIHSIAAADGRVMGVEALENRIGTESNGNIITVYVSRFRTLLRELGIPDPIKTVWGKGWRWAL